MRPSWKSLGVGILSASIPCLSLCSVEAQDVASRTKRLEQYVNTVKKIPAAEQKRLSAGAANFFHYAQASTQKPPQPGRGDAALANGVSSERINELARMRASIAGSHAANGLATGVVPVSNASQDFTLSVLEGFTQSETSTTWCGNTVVVGYNDSGSYLRTAGTDPFGAASFNGVASSVDGGRHYRALDYLNAGSNPASFLGGDPVVACANSSTIYYSSLFSTADSMSNPLSAISVSTSLTGGLVWGEPAPAVAKDGFAHTLDKDWMAIDPKTPTNLYVTYTDFDGSGASAGCGFDFRYAIELVGSKDGGATWSAPVSIAEECGSSLAFVQGSQVAVDHGGKVYVAYEYFGGDGSRAIKLRSSINYGASFGSTVEVSSVTPTGDGGVLQGEFRTNEFPSLAIDPNSRELYISWGDGRNDIVPDLGSFSGTYAYGDVLVSKSTDGGHHWSAPTTVSPVSGSYAGIGRDQFMPGIAVDHSGTVAVCYYDRRNDPLNQVVDRYCSTSWDRGGSWKDARKTVTPWLPTHGTDALINPAYMGDYDFTASDTTGANPGFVGAFEIITKGNPDVFAAKF